jgi:peptidoglycan/LPS O-acetylase OafA/YrhL
LELGGARFNYWDLKFNVDENYLMNLVHHVTYLGMFNLKYANTMIGVEWSLNIEMFFYCIFGLLITRSILKPTILSIIVALFVSLLIAVAFLALSYMNIIDGLLVHWMPFKYGWMFLLGGLSYFFRKEFNDYVPSSLSNLLSNITLILSLVVVSIYLNVDLLNKIGVVNEAFFSFLTFVLIIIVKDKALFSIALTNRYVIFLGTISFSFYLIHMIIITLNVSGFVFGVTNLTAAFFIHFVITLFLSFAWYEITEQFIYNKVKFSINKYCEEVAPTVNQISSFKS